MPKYECKDCGAIWYGWGAGKACPNCRGELGQALKNTATFKCDKFKIKMKGGDV